MNWDGLIFFIISSKADAKSPYSNHLNNSANSFVIFHKDQLVFQILIHSTIFPILLWRRNCLSKLITLIKKVESYQVSLKNMCITCLVWQLRHILCQYDIGILLKLVMSRMLPDVRRNLCDVDREIGRSKGF